MLLLETFDPFVLFLYLTKCQFDFLFFCVTQPFTKTMKTNSSSWFFKSFFKECWSLIITNLRGLWYTPNFKYRADCQGFRSTWVFCYRYATLQYNRHCVCCVYKHQINPMSKILANFALLPHPVQKSYKNCSSIVELKKCWQNVWWISFYLSIIWVS